MSRFIWIKASFWFRQAAVERDEQPSVPFLELAGSSRSTLVSSVKPRDKPGLGNIYTLPLRPTKPGGRVGTWFECARNVSPMELCFLDISRILSLLVREAARNASKSFVSIFIFLKNFYFLIPSFWGGTRSKNIFSEYIKVIRFIFGREI